MRFKIKITNFVFEIILIPFLNFKTILLIL
jgi:hypothetical protein